MEKRAGNEKMPRNELKKKREVLSRDLVLRVLEGEVKMTREGRKKKDNMASERINHKKQQERIRGPR